MGGSHGSLGQGGTPSLKLPCFSSGVEISLQRYSHND